MEFEWDESKREGNLAKHGIDFARAITILSKQVIDPAGTRFIGDEMRHIALGVIGTDDLVIGVVYTNRGSVRRIISARRGRRHERERYKSEFGVGA